MSFCCPPSLIARRSFSTLENRNVPLFCFAWKATDPRVKTNCYVGSSLFDGNYRTTWEHYQVAVRQAMTSSLAYLKGGSEQLPRGTMIPLTEDGKFLRRAVYDILQHSQAAVVNLKDTNTIFHKKYDIICPLPSSKGPASPPNQEVSRTIASSLGLGPNSVMNLVMRSSALPVKSTKLDRSIRMEDDAPRLIHYDTMKIDPELFRAVKGKAVLLYDDVVKYGNTSEAARNLLILAGAAEVDLITCFSTGEYQNVVQYELLPGVNETAFTLPQKENFGLVKSEIIPKKVLKWQGHQESLKEWHNIMNLYVESYFPEFVPNDIPWL